nr:GTP-binding protein [Leptolyngbya sp. FACHB-671]
MAKVRPQDSHFNRARVSLRQALNQYTQFLRVPKRGGGSIELQAAIKADLDHISTALDKLNHSVFRVAVFGLVSRGKSAVLNALVGQKLLQTGPLNGVTQWARSVYWSPSVAGEPFQVELIDTPGLDEIGGQARATLAREVAQQADLILFVIAGDMTRTEYRALMELQQAHKPLILVFNKTDLYPDRDRQTIYEKLQTLFASSGDRYRPILSPDDIVMVAADPAPVEVRVEWEDGRVTHEWEAPPFQVDELKQKLLEILNRDGKSLLALNALRQARESEEAIAHKTLKLHQAEAEDLIWQFTRWKSIAIAINPIAFLDVLGGAATDLVMIRSLARLYGLPMTRYEAGKLWNTIVWSSGGLLLGELGSGLLLGVGKSGAAVASGFDSISGFAAYTGAAIAQATLAGYGSYRVGKAAQVYLEQGCTWGPLGANTVIQDILEQIEPDSVVHRLRRELGQ